MFLINVYDVFSSTARFCVRVSLILSFLLLRCRGICSHTTRPTGTVSLCLSIFSEQHVFKPGYYVVRLLLLYAILPILLVRLSVSQGMEAYICSKINVRV